MILMKLSYYFAQVRPQVTNCTWRASLLTSILCRCGILNLKTLFSWCKNCRQPCNIEWQILQKHKKKTMKHSHDCSNARVAYVCIHSSLVVWQFVFVGKTWHPLNWPFSSELLYKITTFSRFFCLVCLLSRHFCLSSY